MQYANVQNFLFDEIIQRYRYAEKPFFYFVIIMKDEGGEIYFNHVSHIKLMKFHWHKRLSVEEKVSYKGHALDYPQLWPLEMQWS